MGEQGVVANAREVQFVREVRSHRAGNAKGEDATAGPQPAFEHSVVGAAAGQVGGYPSYGCLGPALDRFAVVDAALDKGTGVLIGDLCLAAGVPRPVDLAHEVAEDGVGPAREHEQ